MSAYLLTEVLFFRAPSNLDQGLVVFSVQSGKKGNFTLKQHGEVVFFLAWHASCLISFKNTIND